MGTRGKNKLVTDKGFFQIFGQQVGRTAVLTVLSIALIIFFSAGWWIGKLSTTEYGVVLTAIAGGIVALITLTQPNKIDVDAHEHDGNQEVDNPDEPKINM